MRRSLRMVVDAWSPCLDYSHYRLGSASLKIFLKKDLLILLIFILPVLFICRLSKPNRRKFARCFESFD